MNATLYRLLGVTALCLGTAWPSAGRAELLTFELENEEVLFQAPAGYGGFAWDNVYLMDTPRYDIPDSGYLRGLVSGRHVAYNSGGDPARLMKLQGRFDFDSAWLTAAWNEGLNVTVQGWRNDRLLYTRTVVVGDDAPTLFQFGFKGIDELRWRSFGGVDAGTPGGGEHFVMDDFTFTPAPAVPEPAAWSLLALGVVAVAGRARRRRGRAVR